MSFPDASANAGNASNGNTTANISPNGKERQPLPPLSEAAAAAAAATSQAVAAGQAAALQAIKSMPRPGTSIAAVDNGVRAATQDVPPPTDGSNAAPSNAVALKSSPEKSEVALASQTAGSPPPAKANAASMSSPSSAAAVTPAASLGRAASAVPGAVDSTASAAKAAVGAAAAAASDVASNGVSAAAPAVDKSASKRSPAGTPPPASPAPPGGAAANAAPAPAASPSPSPKAPGSAGKPTVGITVSPTPSPLAPSASGVPGPGAGVEPSPFSSATSNVAAAIVSPPSEINPVPSGPVASSSPPAGTGSGAAAPALAEQSSVAGSLPTLPKKASKKLSFAISGAEIKDALRAAGKEAVAAGNEAKATATSLAKLPFDKTKQVVTLSLDQAVTLLFFVILLFNLLLFWLVSRGILGMLANMVLGTVLGLGLSLMYYYNLKRKSEVNTLLATNIGFKGVQYLMGNLPSWYNNTEKEKMEWFNELIVEVWPFVDKAVCAMVKDITAVQTAKVLKQQASLNKVVKSIGFKHLTFGMAPFRVESIWVSPDDKQSLVMEVDVKWCGDPNITLAIELPTGGKICPRVMDITFVGTIRIVLNPLTDRIPGFVAAMATLRKPPMIKYRLDFGKALGGSYLPAAVTPVINYFMKDVLNKMLVWPQRLVVPIIQQTVEDKLEIQRMMLRSRGVLRIYVRDVKNMRAMDTAGVNDTFVELSTDNDYVETTKQARGIVDKKIGKKMDRQNQRAIWKEYKYLLVQEPTSQTLRVEVYDKDLMRPMQLLAGEVSSKSLVGRCAIKLQQDVCPNPGQDFMAWHHLGKADWGSPGGPGKGYGKLRLKMMYRPFETLTEDEVRGARRGIVLVRLLQVSGLSRKAKKNAVIVNENEAQTAYVRVSVKDKAHKREPWTSANKTWTLRAAKARVLAAVHQHELLRAQAERDGKEEEIKVQDAHIAGYKKLMADDRFMVDLDWSVDPSAQCVFYGVRDDGEIKIKVMEPSTLSNDEVLAVKESIPITDLIEAYCYNPLSGIKEYGLRVYPEGIELEGDTGKTGHLPRIFVAMRWVPWINDMDNDDIDDDAEVAAEGGGEDDIVAQLLKPLVGEDGKPVEGEAAAAAAAGKSKGPSAAAAPAGK